MGVEPTKTASDGPRALASRPALLLLLALAVCWLAVGVGKAAAAPIEGVWSFNGGAIAIKGQDDGSFVGTVVEPTKFTQCYHPTGEDMWTEIQRQPDGSYQGLHQWYFVPSESECVRNPTLGKTAWRVLEVADGSKVLRVCFSAPGSASQPTIAPDGSSQGTTPPFGCSDSAKISALPSIKPSEVGKYLALPAAHGCIGRPKMKVRIHNVAGDPFEKISVRLRSGKLQRRAKLKRLRGGAVATLNLKGLPESSFTVSVRATTVLGAHVFRKRSYRVCATPPAGGAHRRSQDL